MKKTDSEALNPWKGLDSYTENDKHLFCGREQEIRELTDLIEHCRIVTLYGRSGTGKTSLIKAGVFARLTQLGEYSPIVLRLLKDCNISEESYEKCIERYISSLPENTEPVIVLDQFEEILREYPRQSVIY